MADKVKKLKTREVRAILSQRLGYEVDLDKWKYFKCRGLVPRFRGKNKYDPWLTYGDVEEMTVRILEHVSKEKDRVQFRYRCPGVWRQAELRREIERRTGIEMPYWKFKYLQKLGVIPEGEVSMKTARGNVSMHKGYSIRQLEMIIATLPAYVVPIQNRC